MPHSNKLTRWSQVTLRGVFHCFPLGSSAASADLARTSTKIQVQLEVHALSESDKLKSCWFWINNTSRVTNCYKLLLQPPRLVLRAKGCNAILGRPDVALAGFAIASKRISRYEVSKHVLRSSNFPPSMIVLGYGWIWNYHVPSYYYNIFQWYLEQKTLNKNNSKVNPVQSPSQDPSTRSLWHRNAPRSPVAGWASEKSTCLLNNQRYPKVTHLHCHILLYLAIHWKFISNEHLMNIFCQNVKPKLPNL